MDEYSAYLANVYGYGFEGKPFCRVPFDGPKSRAAVERWLTFWKEHSAYFKEGYLHHLRAPDGERIDAVMHLREDGRKKQALVVAFNPTPETKTEELVLNVSGSESGKGPWRCTSESGESMTITGRTLPVAVPAFNATWYELLEIEEHDHA